jgi:hypothetical protein
MTKSKLAIIGALMLDLMSPAFAQSDLGYGKLPPISQHRAEAIHDCQQSADDRYGPSGDRDWRRFDHDTYAACMFDQGEPE